jgi:hypothetical protein
VALLFALYPADTTDPFLTNALGIQPSLFFVLTATYAYLNARWFLAYILATGSLLTYESLFFLFFAAPYLRADDSIKHGRRHALILVGILSGYVFLRQLSSEERVANIEMIAALQNLVGRIFYGPIVSFGAFWGRPWEVLSHLSVRDFILGGLLTGIFYLVVQTYIVNPLRQSAPKTDRQQQKAFYRIAGVSLAMASVLGYCTAIPAHLIVTAVDGRASRVHFAAAVDFAGNCVHFGCSVGIVDPLFAASSGPLSLELANSTGVLAGCGGPRPGSPRKDNHLGLCA